MDSIKSILEELVREKEEALRFELKCSTVSHQRWFEGYADGLELAIHFLKDLPECISSGN